MYLRHDHTQGVNEHIYAALAKILESRGEVTIGDKSEIQFRIFEKPSYNEWRKTRRTGPVQLARLCAGRLNQIVERADRFLFGGRYCQDDVRSWGNRDQLTKGIIGQLLVRNRKHGKYRRDCTKQGMIVVGAEKCGDSDHPVGSRPVFHDDGLSPALGKSLCKEPGAEI